MEANISKEQIAALIRRVRAQEPQAFPALLEQYRPLINARVACFATGDFACDADDFRQEAVLTLYRVALSFDLDQTEVEFGLYAKICIDNALISLIRAIKRHRSNVASAQNEQAVSVEESPEEWLLRKEDLRLLLARIQSLLSPFENRVWSLFLAGLKPKEIAQILGKETHSIENAVYRIRCKLKVGLQ